MAMDSEIILMGTREMPVQMNVVNRFSIDWDVEIPTAMVGPTPAKVG